MALVGLRTGQFWSFLPPHFGSAVSELTFMARSLFWQRKRGFLGPFRPRVKIFHVGESLEVHIPAGQVAQVLWKTSGFLGLELDRAEGQLPARTS